MKFPNLSPVQKGMFVNALKNRVFILGLIGFLALLLAWAMPRAVTATFWQEGQEATPPPGEVLATDAALAAEISANSEQTRGVIMGGIILVLIVVGGTLGVIRRKE